MEGKKSVSVFTLLVSGLLPIVLTGTAWAKPVKDPGQIQVLAQALFDPDPATAERAAQALGQDQSPLALDALLNGLAGGLHPSALAAAVTAIVSYRGHELRGQPMFEVVATYAAHRAPAVRRAAILGIAAMTDRRADQIILRAIHDFDPEVRTIALEAVQQRRVVAAAPALLALAAKGELPAAQALAAIGDGETARQIAEKIGEIPDRVVAVTLGGMLRRKDFGSAQIRLEVVRALGKTAGPWAVSELKAYLAAVPLDAKKMVGREAQALIEAREPKPESQP